MWEVGSWRGGGAQAGALSSFRAVRVERGRRSKEKAGPGQASAGALSEESLQEGPQAGNLMEFLS